MKKMICITGIILMGCLFTGAFFSPATAEESNNTVQTQAAEKEIYILKSENNVLVVYKKGENSPYMITDSRIDVLPEGDIRRLKEGIEIEGKANLRKSIEDYCS